MKPSTWLALILLFPPLLMEAQNAAAPMDAPDKQGDYNKIVSRFFEMVKASRFTDAAHVLVDTNPQDEFNVEKHESLASPLQKIQDSFGPFKVFKPLVVKTLGDSVGYVYGLAIYERDPIRYEFMFYKDGPNWRLLHVDFTLDYVPEIRELAGVHLPLRLAPNQPAPDAKPKTPDNPEPPAQPATLPVPPTLSTPAATPSPAPSPAPHP